MSDTDERSEPFAGNIVVASQIVDALSSGLYESPAACLKELINNAYDADAGTVRVYVKPDAETIVIQDDGHGMTRADFERNFKRISESHKREDGSTTARFGRPKIGKIGIGFIAANELCDVMEIESTVEGSARLLRVLINFEEMRLPAAERRIEGTDDIRKGDYDGHVEAFDDVDAHFTRITLHSVREEAQDVWAAASRQSLEGRRGTVYGKRPSSTRKLLASSIKSWDDLDRYSKTFLDVALNVPVQYLEDWIDPQHHSKVEPFERRTRDLAFQVLYDGTEMRKPVVLHGGDETICEPVSFDGEHVSFDGYFYAQSSIIRPQETQGVLLRIRNAAIGGYDRSFMGYPSGESQVLRNWVSSELWADDRLEEAMNIDRRTLRITHPAFVELQDVFHDKLQAFLRVVRRDIYSSRRDNRASDRITDQREWIRAVLQDTAPGLPKPTRDRMIASWSAAEGDSRTRRKLLRNYSVAEVLEVALSTAATHLTEVEFIAYVEDLFDRLRDA